MIRHDPFASCSLAVAVAGALCRCRRRRCHCRLRVGPVRSCRGRGRAPCRRAAADRADVVGGAEHPQRTAGGRLAAFGRGALQHQLAYRRGEARVRADRGRAGDREAELLGLLPGLGVEVVLDLHVIGDEADRHHDHRRRARRVLRLQVVADVRLQPRDVRGAAAALVDELPGTVRHARRRGDRLGDQPGDLQVLGDVGATGPGVGGVTGRAGGVSERVRDRVGGERQASVRSNALRQRVDRRERAFDHRLDETGVVEEEPELVDPESIFTI